MISLRPPMINQAYLCAKFSFLKDSLEDVSSLFILILIVVTKYYPPLRNVPVLKNLSLFSQLLMMREFEVVFWATLNSKQEIDKIIAENFNEANSD